ncbi:pre-rRNA-processing protein esf1 [Tulasnella sp. 427]|nr:pre-rRNA-processing protein esf1 [Tulasnella sp. 427]
MSDPRFARIKTDPRFKRPRKDQHKVVVDERFKEIFESRKAKGKNRAGPKIDKYGRKVSATKERDDLRKFYRLEDEDDQPEAGPSDPEKSVPKRPDFARGEVMMESSDEDEEEDVDSADEGPVSLGPATYSLKKKTKTTDYGDDVPSDVEINLDETEFADLDAQAAAYSSNNSRLGFGEQKRTTQRGQETRRLAVVNLDWDHVKAAHLFKVFNSCASMMDDRADEDDANAQRRRKKTALPTGRSNRILRVTVYPSEFGKERMAKEDVEGPPVEIYADPKNKKDGKNILTDRRLASKGDDDEDLANIDVEDINEKTIYHQEDAEQYDQDALRKYQLERLRYFYAIVECDTSETAAYVYKELDATELERTANLLDLSFVPDDMKFDGECRDDATQDLGNLKPLKFETDALRSSKVKLTWDDDDKDRSELTRRPLTAEEIDANDFKAYLANTYKKKMKEQKLARMNKLEKHRRRNDGEDDPVERNKVNAKRGDAVGEDGFFQLEGSHGGDQSAPEDHEKRANGSDSRRSSPKEELALLAANINGDDGGNRHFDMAKVIKAEKMSSKKKQRFKRKGDRDEGAQNEDEAEDGRDFEINVGDDRFQALHDEYEFAIDPSNPHFKKTKAMSQLLDERRRHLKEKVKAEADGRRDKQATRQAGHAIVGDSDLQRLVQSVKRKSGGEHAPHLDSRKGKKKRL